MRIKEYWEIHGTRRPFPSLYKAAAAYGAENIYFQKPRYEKPGRCPWCGGEVKGKRRRFCCDECRRRFDNMTVWQKGRDAYSLRILYRDNFTCLDCGEFHAFVNEYGMTIPIDDGQLEVHHVKPVADGGGDEPENLRTLCKRCHKKRHDELRKKMEVCNDKESTRN